MVISAPELLVSLPPLTRVTVLPEARGALTFSAPLLVIAMDEDPALVIVTVPEVVTLFVPVLLTSALALASPKV